MQALDSRLATSNHISWAAKVELQVVIREKDARQELVITCYIVTVIYGACCLFYVSLKTLMNRSKENWDYFLQAIANSHSAMALSHNISTVLSRYLNACVCASYTSRMEASLSMKE